MRIVDRLRNHDYKYVISQLDEYTSCTLVSVELPKPLYRIVVGLSTRSETVRYSDGKREDRSGPYVFGKIDFIDPKEGAKFLRKYDLSSIKDEELGFIFGHDAYIPFFGKNKRPLIMRDLKGGEKIYRRNWWDLLRGVGSTRQCIDIFEHSTDDDGNPKPIHTSTLDNFGGSLYIDMGGSYGFSRLCLLENPDLLYDFIDQIRLDVKATSKIIEKLMNKIVSDLGLEFDLEVELEPHFEDDL